jgi:hypothetical protein
VIDLLDEASNEQLLDHFTDEILLLNGLLLGFLLDRSGVGVDLHTVLNHLPWDPRHQRRLPSKHVYIGPKEGDECECLFTIQIPRAAKGLHTWCSK